jgi:hypothetical protein
MDWTPQAMWVVLCESKEENLAALPPLEFLRRWYHEWHADQSPRAPHWLMPEVPRASARRP